MPVQFKDAYGRSWDCTLTLGAAKRIDQADFSGLYKKPFTILALDEEVYGFLAQDRRLAMAIVYCIIEPQVTSHNDFVGKPPDKIQDLWAETVTGQVITDAVNAFWESLADFTPDQRNIILKYRELQSQAMTAIATNLVQTMEQTMPLIVSEVARKAKLLTAKLSTDFTEKPGPS